LLSRVFETDLEHCPNCGGQLKIVAAVLESVVIERILKHLGLQARAPPRTQARERQFAHAAPEPRAEGGQPRARLSEAGTRALDHRIHPQKKTPPIDRRGNCCSAAAAGHK